MSENEEYIRYAHSKENAWILKERRIFDYLFKRFLKDQYNFLGRPEYSNLPKITDAFGHIIPEDFSVLDLGTGTGRVLKRLIEYGVLPRNIIGIDTDPVKLNDPHYPEDVTKIASSVVNLDLELQKLHSPKQKFNLVTSNMLFHLLTYDEYVKTLKQVRNHVYEHHTQLMFVVPHPLRDGLKSIQEYHSQETLIETAPWGENINYHIKTLQDYERGLREAGFRSIQVATAGVGIGEFSNYFLYDEGIWNAIQNFQKSGKHEKLPHCFRYWMYAVPD